MAKEVPFHSTFTSGFFKEAESEARTAICTKIGLEQLTSTPNFTAKLWSIRARKFIADTFFPVANEDDEDVRTDCKKTTLGIRKALSFLLVVSVLCWVTNKPTIETPLVWLRNSLSYGRSFARDDLAEARPSGQSAPVSDYTSQTPGWCHPVQLYKAAPQSGLYAGQWDVAPRVIVRVPLPAAFLGHTLVQELTSTVQRIADALPQQEQVNMYIYQAIDNLVQEVDHIRSQYNELKRDNTAQSEFQPAESGPVGGHATVLVCIAACMVVMAGFSARQNARHNGDMLKIMQQCQNLHAQVAALHALPEKLNDVESHLKRQQKLAAESRADNYQLHEDLREKLDLSVQDMNMTQSQLAGLLAGLNSDVKFLKSEAHADMARFREAIGELEAEREALHGEIEQRDVQIEEGQKQLGACFDELQQTNKQLLDTVEKLRVREEGVAELAGLMHDLQEELQKADDSLADKSNREQQLLEQLETETKNRVANEGYVDILRSQHDILTKAVVSMNEYLEADESMRVALEGRVEELESERDNLISQLSQSREEEQQAVRNADRYKKEVTEKEKLLHYRKYEMEMLMKMAKENNSARAVAPVAAN